MCSCKQIDWRTAEKILRKNGFEYDRSRGKSSSHRHYVRNGERVIINIRLNPMVWNRLCKEHNLK